MKTAVTDVQYGNTVTPIITIGGLDLSSKCVNLSEITYTQKAELATSIATCSIELDTDTDYSIGLSVKIEANVNGSIVPFFEGVISDATFDDTTNTLNIQAETVRNADKDIWCKTRASDYTFLTQDGPDLPLVFGSGVKYKIEEAWPRNKMTTQSLVGANYANIYIDGGANEVQNTTIDILVAGIVISGQFSGNDFTVDTYNKPFYTDVEGTIQGTTLDPYVTITTDKTLVNQFVWDGTQVNFCWKQTARKCYFLLPVGNVGTTVTFTETSFLLREAWGSEFNITAAYEASKWMFPPGYQYLYEDWMQVKQGAPCCRYDGINYSGKYVINIMPNTELVSLYCNVSENGITGLREIDKSLFPVTNETITGIGNCTVITIWPPLSSISNGFLSDDLYVSARSPVARTATATAQWLCNYANLNLSGTFADWSVDCVIKSSTKVSELLDKLAYETCTPMRIVGNTVYVVSSPETMTTPDSGIISRQRTNPNDHDKIGLLKSTWRKDYYSEPSTIYARTLWYEYNNYNELEYEYVFITNYTQAKASTDYWLGMKNVTRWIMQYVVDHTAYGLEIFDRFTNSANGLVQEIRYDLIEPKVSLTTTPILSTVSVETAPDPIVTNTAVIYFIAGEGNQGAASGPAEELATQGWVWDGNTVFSDSGSYTIYGCRPYTGSDITSEDPNALPTIGTSETAGSYDSGMAGICRVKTSINELGQIVFVLGYSPSIPYWLITNQTVKLGTPIEAQNGKLIYPIVWGV